jgi:hypothetical protein
LILAVLQVVAQMESDREPGSPQLYQIRSISYVAHAAGAANLPCASESGYELAEDQSARLSRHKRGCLSDPDLAISLICDLRTARRRAL